MRGAAGFLANPARLLRWDGFGAQRVAEPVGASAELGEPTRPRAKSSQLVPSRTSGQAGPRRVSGVVPAASPAEPSSRAGGPRKERATTVLVDTC